MIPDGATSIPDVYSMGTLEAPIVDLPTSTLAVFDGPTMLGFSAVDD